MERSPPAKTHLDIPFGQEAPCLEQDSSPVGRVKQEGGPAGYHCPYAVFPFGLTVLGQFVWVLGAMDGVICGIHPVVPSPYALLTIVPGDIRCSSDLDWKETRSKLPDVILRA